MTGIVGPTGDLYLQAALFQAQLRARDAALAGLLTDRYGAVYQGLQGAFDSLALSVRQDIDAGQVFTIDRLLRLDRYQYLARQVDQALAEYSLDAAREIAAAQERAVYEGLRTAAELRRQAEAQGLLYIPTEPGRGALPPGMTEQEVAELFSRLSRDPLTHLIGTMANGAPLYDYFRRGAPGIPGLTPEVIAQIERTLEQALAEGWNPRKAAAAFREAMGVGLDRALRIARTEMLRSYREATRNSYLTYGVQQWEWHASFDKRTCLACAALDGRVFSVHEPQAAHVN